MTISTRRTGGLSIHLLLSILFLGLGAGLSARAAVPVVEIPVTELHPTQPAAGYFSSEFNRKLKFAKAKTQAEFDQLLKGLKPFRAVRGPGGVMFLTDGHHRALGTWMQAQKLCESTPTPACVARSHVKVQVDADYSDKGWKEFAEFMLSSNNVYFPPATREKIKAGKIDKEKLFKPEGGVLPQDMGGIADDPMRSAMGSVFAKLDISGDYFENYLEFLVAERLKKPVKVLPGHEGDDAVVAALEDAIFEDADVLAFMRCLARRDDQNWQHAQSSIEKVLKKHGKPAPATPFTAASCPAGVPEEQKPVDAAKGIQKLIEGMKAPEKQCDKP